MTQSYLKQKPLTSREKIVGRWEVRVIAVCEDRVVLVKSNTQPIPDRWFPFTERDSSVDEGPEQTAQRALLAAAGIGIEVMQLQKIHTSTKHGRAYYSFAAALTPDDLKWTRSCVPGKTVKIHTVADIEASPLSYGKYVITTLEQLDIIEKKVKQKKLFAEKAPSEGVCGGGHTGTAGTVCTDEKCAGSPFRS